MPAGCMAPSHCGVWGSVTLVVIRSLTSRENQPGHTKPVTPGGGGPLRLPHLPSSWDGGGSCLALAPQKELGFGLNRDPEAIKFILRTCCQRSNKFICSFRQGVREILLHQVFALVFFSSSPQRVMRVWIFLPLLSVKAVRASMKMFVCLHFYFYWKVIAN